MQMQILLLSICKQLNQIYLFVSNYFVSSVSIVLSSVSIVSFC